MGHWTTDRAEFQRPHLGEFTRAARTYHQRAETTDAQREILTAVDGTFAPGQLAEIDGRLS